MGTLWVEGSSTFYSNTPLSTISALQNPLIISRIFSLLSLEEIKYVRLVCKNWKKITLQRWRSSSTLRMIWRKEYVKTCTGDCCGGCEKTDDANSAVEIFEFMKFVAKCEDLESVPFSHYKLTNYCFLHPPFPVKRSKVELKFWISFGPHITHLHFDHCGFHDHPISQIFVWIVEKCKNLEVLKLKTFLICPLPDLDFDAREELIVESNLFPERAAEKLLKLSWTDCDGIIPWCLQVHARTSYTDYFVTARLFPNLITLETFTHCFLPVVSQSPFHSFWPRQTSWSFPGDNFVKQDLIQLTDYLRLSKINLQTLKFNVRKRLTNVPVNPIYFYDLFKCCEPTLQRLELGGRHLEPETSISNYLKEHYFIRLTDLQLADHFGVSFKALTGMPNLQRLFVHTRYKRLDWNLRIGAESDLVFAWKALYHFRCDYYQVNKKSLTTLATWMPQLKELEMVFYEGLLAPSMQQVRDLWPQLQRVTSLKDFEEWDPSPEYVILHNQGLGKPFECDNCGNGFRKKCDLERHTTEAHGNAQCFLNLNNFD